VIDYAQNAKVQSFRIKDDPNEREVTVRIADSRTVTVIIKIESAAGRLILQRCLKCSCEVEAITADELDNMFGADTFIDNRSFLPASTTALGIMTSRS
jgi:hypothetical protein